VGSVEGWVYYLGGGDRRREGVLLGDKCGHPIVTNGGVCGVVILVREGWRLGFSQITLGFFSLLFEHPIYVLGLYIDGYRRSLLGGDARLIRI